MMKRQWHSGARTLLAAVLVSGAVSVIPADAQIVRVGQSDTRNTVTFNLGYFALPGAESRVDDDAIVPNLLDLARREDLAPLEIGDFNSVSFGGEWLYGITEYLEVGAGVGFYRKTVETAYAHDTHEDGSDIAQDLKLRIVPVTATVRFLPFGRSAAVQPYAGVGIGILNWRYTEIGEFIDEDGFVFSNVENPFDKSGTAVGPVVLFGLRAPIGDVWSIGADFRWQKAEGDGLLAEDDFLGDKIDLGGWTSSVTFGFRF
jgi:opacity protein-like surface antigen